MTLQWRNTELPEERLSTEVMWQMTPFEWFSSYRTAWESQSEFLDSEFVAFMNENVFAA